MDENRKTILNSIKDYFMNPAKTLNDQRSKIEETINELDDVLKGTGKDSGLCEDFFDFLVKSSELIDIIKKSRADEQGLSATRGYKDYYFNEIIQNANDNTKGTVITISVSKENDYYVLSFEYDDDGFSTENLIGFFNSEIHTKGQDNSTTGKHGVGIKSLFYFVDSMEIESNVHIEIHVNTVPEDGIEKFQEEPVTVNISKNDHFSKKTVLTIKFRGGPRSGQVNFNTSKLEKYIDNCLEKKLDSKTMNEYFFNQTSDDLIFDARALLFTDKNRGKVGGIKRICFRDAAAEKLFEIFARTDGTTKETEVFSCEDKNGNLYTLQEDELSISNFNTEPQVIDKYLVIKKQYSDKKKQNFTVAFPGVLEYKQKGRTYYETYFIPYSNDERFNYNLLVNTDHSSPDRTRLTDGNDFADIIKEVDSGLCDVYEFVFSEKCQSALSKKLKMQLSVLFHQMLLKDGMAEGSFLNICLERNISNRYLMKYTDEKDDNAFLMYRRNEKEEYEKKLIGQKTDVKDIKDFFEKHILYDDSVKYEQNNLLNDDIKNAYGSAFNGNNDLQMKLRRVLNLAGDIRSLIYYRIMGEFCVEDNMELSDFVVDEWTDRLETKGENVGIGLSLIGRYGLNSRIDKSGHITGASFYTFLFSDDPISNPVDADTSCEKFRNKASSMFADLNGLKERLRKGMLSYSNGDRKISFWASWDTRARCDTDIISNENLKWHNGELNDEDVKQLICRMSIGRDDELIHHIKRIFLQGEWRLVLTGPEYPKRGKITFYSGVSSLATAQKKDTEFIDFSFLLNLNAKSWDEYCAFYDFISNQDKLENLGKFQIVTPKFQIVTPDKGVKIYVSELKELFKFLYKHDTKKKWIICQLNLRIEGDPKNLSNQCPEDLGEFIERLTGLKVYLWEVPAVNKRWEVLYGYEQKIKSYNKQEWTDEATIKNYEANDNRVIILFNGKKDYREAIQSVLKSILGKDDILDKLDAFLTSSNNMQIQGEKYDRLGNRNMEDNDKYSRKFSSDIATDQFTCEQLIKLILARGIQDHKCACCGCDLLDEKQAKLIISNNENDESKEDFPQIYEVVCTECKSLLKSSLNSAEIVIQEKEKWIKYRCVGGNSRQSDPVCWKHKVADGLISICKSNLG